MRSFTIRASLLGILLGLAATAGHAQDWDGATRAASWAKQDKDDSFTFYDAQGRFLHTWMRDGGVFRSVPLAKFDGEPERWVIDPRGNAWVAQGTTLTQLDRSNGRNITSVRLPAEVGDICWDPRGFVISYRTAEPYLEKRDYTGKDVLWAFGAKPSKGDGPAPTNRRPIVSDDSGNVIMADGNSLNLSIIDGSTGRKLRETNLRLEGAPAPLLEGNTTERRSICLWAGKGVVFAALTANQLPAAQRGTMEGIVLARLDITRSSLEFLATGLDPSHLLVGILESDAVFVNPRGGLMLAKIK